MNVADSVVRLVGIGEIAAIRIAHACWDEREVMIPSGTVMGTLELLSPEEPECRTYRPRLWHLNQVSLGDEGIREERPSKPYDEAYYAYAVEAVIKKAATEVDVTPQMLKELREVLDGFKHTMASTKLGESNVFVFDIDPGQANPVCHPDKRFSHAEFAAIKQHVEALVQAGLVEPANSPWSARLVCVPKKGTDGKRTDVRICVDFRDVNRLCYKDAFLFRF